MKFLNKLEKKFGRFAIHNLMVFIIGCYIIGYVIQFTNPQSLLLLTLEPYRIIQYGEIWRIISWILIPPQTGIFWALIMCIFYYQLGTTLERTWGAFRFNLYIFGGIIFTIIGAFILYFATGQTQGAMGGYFTTYYINLSIFLAFALSYPDMRVYLYFFIPIKMKWMAIVYIVLAAYSAIASNVAGRVAILMSLLNFVIFFFATRNYKSIDPKQAKRQHDFRKAYNQGQRQNQQRSAYGQNPYGNQQNPYGQPNQQSQNPYGNQQNPYGQQKRQGQPHQANPYQGGMARHKCAVCGRTELDNPNLEFRYCSKCSGNFEYCSDHLFTHEHK